MASDGGRSELRLGPRQQDLYEALEASSAEADSTSACALTPAISTRATARLEPGREVAARR